MCTVEQMILDRKWSQQQSEMISDRNDSAEIRNGTPLRFAFITALRRACRCWIIFFVLLMCIYVLQFTTQTEETEELSTVLFILSIYAFLSADFIHHPCLNYNPFLNFPQDYAVINTDYCGLFWGSLPYCTDITLILFKALISGQ